MSVINSLIVCLDDADFPVVISAAISLQAYLTSDERLAVVRPNLQHVIERFVMILQKVAVEEVMQTFDILINRFSSEVMDMSVGIVAVLLRAFEQYKKDEENDSSMFTAMSTLDCVSSVVMNACEGKTMCDAVVEQVLPAVMVPAEGALTRRASSRTRRWTSTTPRC